MKINKIKSEIRILALRLLLAELFLGGVIFTINIFMDLEGMYTGLFGNDFFKYDMFSVAFFLLLEVVVILLVVWRWQKRYLKLNRPDKIMELLDEGEGEYLEFKSSMRWDFREQRFNKELEKAIVKSVAGFLNSDGGILLVGVNDNKEITGLKADFDTLPKANIDSWENHFNQLVKNFLKLSVRRLINVSFAKVKEKTVAVIEIKKSENPVYYRDGENESFFVRTGNSTNALSISGATEYIEGHWRKKG